MLKGAVLGATVGAGVAVVQAQGSGEQPAEADSLGPKVAKAAAEGMLVGGTVGFFMDRRARRKAEAAALVAGPALSRLARKARAGARSGVETAATRARDAATAARPHVEHAAELARERALLAADVAREKALEAAETARPHVRHAADVARERAIDAAEIARERAAAAAEVARLRATELRAAS